MRTVTESSGVVLHDMIERIYFYFIIFSQKRKWKREPHGRRGSSRCSGAYWKAIGYLNSNGWGPGVKISNVSAGSKVPLAPELAITVSEDGSWVGLPADAVDRA